MTLLLTKVLCTYNLALFTEWASLTKVSISLSFTASKSLKDTMHVLWQEDSQEEDWIFLLIDAWNKLNEENRTAMLWAVRNEWPSGAQFTFNCYHHWSTLVVRGTGDGSGHLLRSKESVTQG